MAHFHLVMMNFHMFVNFLFVLQLTRQSNSEVRPTIYISSDRCSQSEYFDALSLSCVPCSTIAKVIFSPSANQSAVPLQSFPPHRTVCSCAKEFLLDQKDGKYRCVEHSCEPGLEYHLGECGHCENGQPKCDCPKGKLLHKIYQTNGSDEQYSVHFKCIDYRLSMQLNQPPCHSSYLLASSQPCHCPSSHIEEGGLCIDKNKLISDEDKLKHSLMNFGSAQFISKSLYLHLRAAVYSCNVAMNQSACHYLLNLCTAKVASEFGDANAKVNGEPFQLCTYLRQTNSRLEYSIEWYYLSEHHNTPIKDQFRMKDTVQMRALFFESKGHLKQVDHLRLNDLLVCPYQKLRHSEVTFGTDLHRKCRWKPSELWRWALMSDNGYYMQIYLLAESNKLFHVPVKVGSTLHTTTRSLMKRFFLFDSQLGVDQKDGNQLFVTFAKSIRIEFRLSKHTLTSQIYPPSISIEYQRLESSAVQDNLSLETEFSVTFRMDDSDSKYKLSLLISVLSSMAFFWAIFRTWCWKRRSGHSRVDHQLGAILVVEAISAVSNILIISSLLFTIKQLLVFKYQSMVHTMMLDLTQESNIVFYLFVAYICKIVQLITSIMTFTSIDIFFIDWEKPRKNELFENYAKSDSQVKEGTNNFATKRNESSYAGHRLASGQAKLHDSGYNVTIWRRYFVANEWFELSLNRRINIGVHIFLLLVLLECTSWKQLSKMTPYFETCNEDCLEEIPESSLARIALAAMFYTVLALSQYLYKKYLCENFGCGKLNEFIDLCSVSNISVFCLKQRKYGFYLHGLSPNGRSDVNMLEMYSLLEIEESDLCSKRGLLPNTEQQTFEMCLPLVIHDHWLTLYRNLVSQKGGISFGSKPVFNLHDINKEKLVQTYSAINRFLCNFIEHTFPKADYVVQERSAVESLLNFEMSSVRDKGCFYNDNGHSFENALFYGIESTVTIVELMTFLMIDLVLKNFILAGSVTYLLSKLLMQIYAKMSRKNLVCKTLMDERFLI